MKNVRIAFKFNDEIAICIGHKRIGVHWVFNIKMIMLGRKARLVTDGNETEAPKDMNFSSAVSRE